MKILKQLMSVLLILAVIGGVRALTRNYFSSQPADIGGITLTKETFNAGCVDGATENGNATDADATAYCGCVYDKGVAEYGAEGWTNEITKAGETSVFTPKVNEFINQCITATYEGTI